MANLPSPPYPSKEKPVKQPITKQPLLPAIQVDSSPASQREEELEALGRPDLNVCLNDGESPFITEKSPMSSRPAGESLPLELVEPQSSQECKEDRNYRILCGLLWSLERHFVAHGNDLDALRAFNRDRSQPLMRKRLLSRWAFNHFLKMETSLEKLLEFLEDDSLTSHNDYHLRSLIIYLQAKEIWSPPSLGTWIKTRIRQEKSSRMELLAVLDSLTIAHAGSTATQLDNQHLNRVVYRGISRGLQNYPFRHNLSSSTLKLMIKCISQNFSTIESLEMCSELISDLKPFQLSQIKHELVDFLIEGPDVQLLKLKYAIDGTQCIQEGKYNTRFRWLLLLLLLKDLPSYIAQECTAKTTLQLLLRAIDHNQNLAQYGDDSVIHSQPNELHIWFSILADSKYTIFRGSRRNTRWEMLWMVIEELLTTLETDVRRLYLSLFKEAEIPVFFDDRIWISRAALQWQERLRSRNKPTYLREPWLWDLPIWSTDQLSSYFKEGYEAGISYLEMVRKARVYSPALLRDFLPRLLSDLRGSNLPRDAANIVRYLRDREFVVDIQVMANEVLEYCKVDALSALIIFLAWRKLRLSHCPGFMEAVIADPNIGHGTIFNVFYRDSENLIPTKRSQREQSPLALTPEQARTLHEMAMAFASVVHLAPAQAFRRVYRCFAHFKGTEEGAGARLSQAMVLSGVIRYLEAGRWVSTTRLIHILNIVREFEGPEIADEVDRLVYEWRGEVINSPQYKEASRLQYRELQRQSRKQFGMCGHSDDGSYSIWAERGMLESAEDDCTYKSARIT